MAGQLIFYAFFLSHQNPNIFSLDKGILGYWNILEGEWVPVVSNELEEAFLTTSKKKKLLSLDQLVSIYENKLCESYDDLLFKKQPFTPVEGAYCDWCSYKGLCRKDDPAYSDKGI